MAKVKNKRNSGLADKVHNKKRKEANKKKLNPFEVHINKEKLQVLGKKSKHDRGLRGVSRAKGMKKRKETLGIEMKVMHKTNAFIDRRIGEKNDNLSAEDRMLARFALERARTHTKKSIYNLADDEILTHRGQTLEQIEKFDDPRSSDDEDDGVQKPGALEGGFVSEGHFGGGILSKSNTRDGAKSHKDLIEQLIEESKKRKAEKQKEKDQTLDLTEKLDTEWKDLQPLIKKPRLEKESESLIDKVLSKAEKSSQDYDKMLLELIFEKRGTPSDGLKSEEEIKKAEKKRLERLEQKRQRRMLGEHEEGQTIQPTSKHRSADDLDDNFDLDDEQEVMLAYDKDGNPLLPENILKGIREQTKKMSMTSEKELEDSDSEEDGNESIEEEEETNEKSNASENLKGSQDSDSEADCNESDKGKGTHEISNVSKNLKESQDSDSEADCNESDKGEETNQISDASNNLKQLQDSDSEDDCNESVKEEEKTIETGMPLDDLNDLKDSDMEEDYTETAEDTSKIETFFNNSGNNLHELLDGKTPPQQSAVLQNLIKSYDPSLAEGNKDLLSKLFSQMLQYVNDIFTNLKEENDIAKAFLTFNKIAPHFYDLAHINKVSCKQLIAEVLQEKHNIYRKKPKRVPDLDTLIFFKLVSLLYPTSDFRHPITTPSLIFMAEILTMSIFNDAYSISRGLFITSLILEYTVLSKRYVPSAINYIRGVLYLAANVSIINPIQVVPPFQLHKSGKILNLNEDCSSLDVEYKMKLRDFILQEVGNDFKIRSVLTSALMLKEFFENCNDMEAQEYIFEAHLKLLNRLDLDNYPKKVSSMISEVSKHMKESLEMKTYIPLTKEKKRPKTLRLYEPEIEEVFTGSKSSKLPRETAEKRRLTHKYKKEMKGALREIRRDKSYIANVKLKQKIQSDKIRKEKVKQLYKEALSQN